ncbi:hypothetical protein CK203_116838 [Vitis vinifera]|uniref:Uncharacterized protein n=1 Tax=Vitis vinifera TaxID=29760 RepID=A0A438DFK7_VITVI|nr:hypothetical protein CK203_116838 [Vitis vinifera]
MSESHTIEDDRATHFSSCPPAERIRQPLKLPSSQDLSSSALSILAGPPTSQVALQRENSAAAEAALQPRPIFLCHSQSSQGLFVVVPLDLNFTNPKSTIFEPDFVSCARAGLENPNAALHSSSSRTLTPPCIAAALFPKWIRNPNLLATSVEIISKIRICRLWARNTLKPGDVIQCRECGYRILYKKRTRRSKDHMLPAPSLHSFSGSATVLVHGHGVNLLYFYLS